MQEFKTQINNPNPGNKRRVILYEPLKSISKNSSKSTLIEADKSRITQVLSNLISNAIKFTEEGGIVDVKLDTVNQQAKNRKRASQERAEEKREEGDENGFIVTVKDNGLGIDPEIFSKLFTKFVSKSYHGTGLGLFISKSIIEAHGGKIWAENSVGGRGGAAFSFKIPISYSGKRSLPQAYQPLKSHLLGQATAK
jgi:signal transduction histidine kinase